MILGHHIILSAYGFWLPNDPRGSWSNFVGSWELYRFGRATKADNPLSVAHNDHDWKQRLAAKTKLKYPPVHFSQMQIAAIGMGIEQASRESGYTVHACAILPEHIHLVIGRHPRNVCQIMPHFKSRATHSLIEERLWLDKDRPVWAKGGWSIFLDCTEDMIRSIRYVEDNPEKEGKTRQYWPFVKPYE